MAEIKFNFYNVFSDYYRNIYDVSKFNIFLYPKYESIHIKWVFMDILYKFYSIILPLYLLYQDNLIKRMDYKIHKSLKKIHREKIFVKTVFFYKNCNFKIYNLFSF